jgi:hypothetical protein
MLAAISVAVAGLGTTASALTLSVVGPTVVDVSGGATMFQVDIVADEGLAVGSTDIDLNWDAAGIEATAASTTALSGFTSNVDNPARQVRTASASAGTDSVPLGTPLLSITLVAGPGDEGLYNLFISDGDGVAPDDLAGPVPPIPPVAIPYASAGLAVEVVPEPSTALLLLSALAGLSLCSGRLSARARRA